MYAHEKDRRAANIGEKVAAAAEFWKLTRGLPW